MNINSKASDTISNSSVEALAPTKGALTTQPLSTSTTFGEVFSAQATLLKGEISNQTLNVAKLLSPNVQHAGELIGKEKLLHENIIQSTERFEKNINQVSNQNSEVSLLRGRLQNTSIDQGLASGRMTIAYPKLMTQTNPLGLRGDPRLNSLLSLENASEEVKQIDSEIVSGNKTTGMEGAKKEVDERDILDEASKKNSDRRNADECTPEDNAELMSATTLSFSLENFFANSDKSNVNVLTLHSQIAWAFGSKEWHDELAKNTAVMFCSDNNTAVLHIKSPDLMGDLKIVIQLAGGRINAMFISADVSTLEILQDSFDQLRSSMLDAGVELGHVMISSDLNQLIPSQDSAKASLDRLNWLTPNLGLIADDDMLSNKILSFYA